MKRHTGNGESPWFIYVSYGDTLLFAENLGWVEPTEPKDAKVDWGDYIEESAIEYIESKGYEIDWDRWYRLQEFI